MSGKTPTQRERESKQQVADFRKAARELGADESEERFQDTLRKIAKHKPKDEKPDRDR
jgi:hypothetical protein